MKSATTLEDAISSSIKEHLLIVSSILPLYGDNILKSVKIMVDCLARGRTIFWCGNGGSAADSQHMAAELVGRFKKDRKALRSIALTTDSSILTCIANDYKYEDIFSRQLEALADEGDVLVAISTSGNSQNIKNALKAANRLDVETIALLGNDGGICANLSNVPIVVKCTSTTHTRSHILIGHIFCD